MNFTEPFKKNVFKASLYLLGLTHRVNTHDDDGDSCNKVIGHVYQALAMCSVTIFTSRNNLTMLVPFVSSLYRG